MPRWVAVLGAMLAAAAVGGCASSRAPGTTSPRSPSSGTPSKDGRITISSGHAHEFAVHDGDLVRGIGYVVAAPGKPVKFCSGDVASTENTPFDACVVGVTVVGANLKELYDPKTQHGIVRGGAEITGVFHDRTITVRSQIARDPSTAHHFSLTDNVPCDPPDGGWPKNGRAPAWNAIYRYERDHPNAIVQLAELHPYVSSKVFYVLTAGDPGPVRAALAPTYGNRLCVEKSLYSARQLATARTAVQGLMTHRGDLLTTPTGGAGIGLSPTLQVDTDMEVGMIDDHLAQVVDRQPAGLVDIHPWLTPVR